MARLEELRREKGDDPAALAFAAERSVEMMQAYCRREELPQELTGVGVSLAEELLESGIIGAHEAQVTSIREGDVTVAFGAGAFAAENVLTARYAAELERFRKMAW